MANKNPLDGRLNTLPSSADAISWFPPLDPYSLHRESTSASPGNISLPPFPFVNLHDYPFTSGPTLPSAVTSDKPHSSPARSRSASRRDPSYVPRPRNAFMLFRIEFNARKQRHQGNLTQKDVSHLAGACWRELPESRKQVYRDMASKERDIHMAKHPSYTYRYNDERNLLRKPASAPGQLRNSTEPKNCGR